MTRPTRPRTRPRPETEATGLDCRHFGTCGGCSRLDQPIAWQIHDKVQTCERLLAPFLGPVRIASAPPPRPPRHFRTRLLFPVQADRRGQPITGLYASHSHTVVRLEQCWTLDPWLTAFAQAAERTLRDLGLQPYDLRRRQGQVKAIWARLASGTGQVMAGVVTRPGTFAAGQDLAAAWLAAAAALPPRRVKHQLVGVVHSISERDDDFLLGDRHVPLRGADHVVDRRAGLEFRISAGSFYQIHAEAEALLYRPALALLGPVRGLHVVDGYGGVGTFGLRLARAGAAAVTIVEEGAAACRDAAHNATRNRLANVRVVRTPFAGARLPQPTDVLVVDPPRAGLGPQAIARIAAAAPPRLLYVSCAPESLARDLDGLVAAGYRVGAARLCDLFPHTEHCELVLRLDRASGGPPTPLGPSA
ncbi:MAG: 23S rRNA (uracil(1939)-C(5))-methyltransferase RlmD [Planctomycetes bacterium]|nr:23S rRNA (uracil(1939)-C(5))-methyltransferase RlmD [Planctomycetota bacterium]